jgi:hypothetical protein
MRKRQGSKPNHPETSNSHFLWQIEYGCIPLTISICAKKFLCPAYSTLAGIFWQHICFAC